MAEWFGKRLGHLLDQIHGFFYIHMTIARQYVHKHNPQRHNDTASHTLLFLTLSTLRSWSIKSRTSSSSNETWDCEVSTKLHVKAVARCVLGFVGCRDLMRIADCKYVQIQAGPKSPDRKKSQSCCESKVRCIDDVFVVMLRGDRRNPAESLGQRLCRMKTANWILCLMGWTQVEARSVRGSEFQKKTKTNRLQALVRLETVLHSFRAFSVSEVSAEPYLRKTVRVVRVHYVPYASVEQGT